MIGSRQATASGETLAREIAGELVNGGYTVNSGLAVDDRRAWDRDLLAFYLEQLAAAARGTLQQVTIAPELPGAQLPRSEPGRDRCQTRGRGYCGTGPPYALTCLSGVPLVVD